MEFSVIRDRYKRKPYLEVLVDGFEWGTLQPHDKNFRFGVRKAKMILAAKTVIQEFVGTKGAEPTLGILYEFNDDKYGELVSYIRQDEFYAFGRLFKAPWLKLTGRHENSEIGFGLEKANALMELEYEIKKFVNDNS